VSKSQRTKGHNFERAVARDLREILGYGKRGFQSRDGTESPDVVVPYFSVECKAHKTAPVRKALQQAIDCSKEQKVPLAVLKDDYKPPFVVLLYSDFLDILSEWWSLRSNQDEK